MHLHDIRDPSKNQLCAKTLNAPLVRVIADFDLHILVGIVELLYRNLSLFIHRIQCGIDQNALLRFRGKLTLPAGGENQNTGQRRQQHEKLHFYISFHTTLPFSL